MDTCTFHIHSFCLIFYEKYLFRPLQIKTPILTDQRLERLISDYGTRGPSAAADVPPPSVPAAPLTSDFRGVARALYSFTAHSPR